jgi:hypothetical protein
MKNKSFTPTIIDSGAELSADKVHRYLLYRTWDYNLPRIMFIGLNPSRATGSVTDATITRCINHAHRWGFGSMYFANLYSFRTPYVHRKDMEALDVEEQWEPLIENLHIAYNSHTDLRLTDMILKSERVVCCWGNFSFVQPRVDAVMKLIAAADKQPWCMGRNKNASPKHPLYLSKTTQLELLNEKS